MTLIDGLRRDLSDAGYTVGVLAALLGERAQAALERGHRVPALRVLAARRSDRGALEPAAILAQLFVLASPVTRGEAERAFPTLTVEGAVALGLIGIDAGEPGPDADAGGDSGTHPADGEGSVRALLDLRPYSFTDSRGAAEWWIASDLGEIAREGALDVDYVLGVGQASQTLTRLMISRPVARALDIGTGCGIQALHLARHAERVVATDISERALDLARLNAELNGARNIEFRLGSMFDPVRGERFGQVVSNPPFVITPRRDDVPRYEYRDGGMTGDAVVEGFVRGVGEFLEPGGIAQLLGNWEYPRPALGAAAGDGFSRIRGWLGDRPGAEPADDAGPALRGTGPATPRPATPLDAWVIEREVEDPCEYAETWIRDGGTRPGTPAFDLLYAAWLEDFARRGVEAIGFGYLLLRRPAGEIPTLRRFESLSAPLGPAGLGEHLAACLEANDRLAALGDDELAAMSFAAAADVTEERHHRPGEGDPAVILLRQGGGFGRVRQVDTVTAALLGACDGELPVAAICAALSQLLGADEAGLRRSALASVRELCAEGFLLPAD